MENKMNIKLVDRLFSTFPDIYKVTDLRNGLLGFGCECGDGWFELLYNLSEDIQKELNKLSRYDVEEFRATQVKEKFGGLRFYTTYSTDKINWLIREAENKSYKTCELCGASGKLRTQLPWIQTLCGDCFQKFIINNLLCLFPKEEREKRKEFVENWIDILLYKPEPYSWYDKLNHFIVNSIYKCSYLGVGWWWKQLPRQIIRKTKYKFWKIKHWFFKLFDV
jgi:hypothetical protein